MKIYGTGFGTNPGVSITDTYGAISSTGVVLLSDSEIDLNITVASATPAENATITVTSQGYNGQGFQSTGGNSATAPTVQVSVSPLQAPVPQIIFNGSNIAGTTQTVVTGQQIALTSSVNPPLSILNQDWTVPGTVVAGYTASTAGASVNQLTNVQVPNITFYWIAPSTLNVTYGYCMTNNQCNSATAAFNVEGIVGTTLSSALGSWMVFTAPNELSFGDVNATDLRHAAVERRRPGLRRLFHYGLGPIPGAAQQG